MLRPAAGGCRPVCQPVHKRCCMQCRYLGMALAVGDVSLTSLGNDGMLPLPGRADKGRNGSMVWAGLRFLAVAALIVSSGCGLARGGSSVDDIVLTSALDADYCPVDDVTTFSSSGPFYCSARVSNLQPGSTVTSRWYYGGQLVEEINYQVQAGGHGCVGFELTSAHVWPRGGYRVEIYLDGELQRMATFAVT